MVAAQNHSFRSLWSRLRTTHSAPYGRGSETLIPNRDRKGVGCSSIPSNFNQQRAPVEPGSKRRKADERACLRVPSASPPFGSRDQHRSRRRISIAANIRIKLLRRHFKRPRHPVDQILIRLVHEKYLDGGRGLRVLLKQF